MEFQNLSSENIKEASKIEYFENLENKLKNPFIQITNNNEQLSIQLDKFACHNIFYFYDEKNFYFATSFNKLVNTVKKNKQLSLEINSVLKFVFTNTFFGNETFLKYFFRLGPGEKLIFDKLKKKLKIIKDFSEFENIDYIYNDFSDVKKFKKKFSDIFLNNYKDYRQPVLLNSGGFDSRLIASLFKDLGIDFKSATYYDKHSLDYKICKKVCDILEVDFNGYCFDELIKEIYYNEESIFFYSDYRLAYHHGHAVLCNKFNNLGNSFFAGIWFEFFATGFTRKDKNLPKSQSEFNNYLIDLFDNGPWSGISFKKLSNLMLNKKYQNIPHDGIKNFVEKFGNIDVEKKLDLVHFFSHGVGRYMSVMNMLSMKLNIIIPGFNSDLFFEMLSVNPLLRMDRKFEFELINSINKNLSNLEFVKDNHKLVYLGKSKIKKIKSLMCEFLKKRKIGILKPHYDIYVKDFNFFNSKGTNRDYFSKIINNNSEIFYDIFNEKYKEFFLEKNLKISHAHFGAMKTFLEFINQNKSSLERTNI